MRNGSNKFLMTKQPQEHWSWISACCKASCSHCSGCTHDKAHAFLDPRVTTRFPMVGQRSKQGDYVTWKNPSEKLNAAQTCLPLPSQWFAKISLINLQMGKLHLHVCLTMSIPTNNFYKQKRGDGWKFPRAGKACMKDNTYRRCVLWHIHALGKLTFRLPKVNDYVSVSWHIYTLLSGFLLLLCVDVWFYVM